VSDIHVYLCLIYFRETAEEIFRAREELKVKGYQVPPEKPASEKFDSNCITPVTTLLL